MEEKSTLIYSSSYVTTKWFTPFIDEGQPLESKQKKKTTNNMLS